MQTEDKVGMIWRFISKVHACFELKHQYRYTLKQIIKRNYNNLHSCPSSPLPGLPVPAALYNSEAECLDIRVSTLYPEPHYHPTLIYISFQPNVAMRRHVGILALSADNNCSESS